MDHEISAIDIVRRNAVRTAEIDDRNDQWSESPYVDGFAAIWNDAYAARRMSLSGEVSA